MLCAVVLEVSQLWKWEEVLEVYIHIYSEGSYETAHALQSVHLLPLIEINLTVNWQDGWTALMYAAQNGHSNVVETLLQHGASVDMQSVVSTL